ncbi:MAG: Smr/MutS family protein [Vicingaceae bacterium]
MEIKVGNSVFVVDEDLSGTVSRVDGNRVTFECEDGFEYTYFKDQLIVFDGEGKAMYEVKSYKVKEAKSHIITTFEHNPTAFFEQKIKFKGKKPEFDLHIEEIAPEAKFTTKHEALLFQLDFVRHVIHLAYRRRVPRLVFVHGVGKGVLRDQLREMLSNDYPNIEFLDGPYSKFGDGATEVLIHGLGKL